MTYKVSISREAEDDLKGIFSYIAYELFSPQNALRQVNRIENAIRSLQEFPRRYKLMENDPWKSLGLHILPCDNFLIFYFIQEDIPGVIISRILYARRNIEKVLIP